MRRILLPSAFGLLAMSAPAGAADLIYVARLDAAGSVAEERTLRCEPEVGCLFAFDEASDAWRQTLSLEIRALPGGVELTGRSAGTADAPLLVARRSLAFGPEGGMATVRLLPEATALRPQRLGGDVALTGFGPFLVGLQPLQP